MVIGEKIRLKKCKNAAAEGSGYRIIFAIAPSR
jgi:hypothetical protein